MFLRPGHSNPPITYTETMPGFRRQEVVLLGQHFSKYQGWSLDKPRARREGTEGFEWIRGGGSVGVPSRELSEVDLGGGSRDGPLAGLPGHPEGRGIRGDARALLSIRIAWSGEGHPLLDQPTSSRIVTP